MAGLKRRTRSSSTMLTMQNAAAMLPLDLAEIDSDVLDELDILLCKIEARVRSMEAPMLSRIDRGLRLLLEEMCATVEMAPVDAKVKATLRAVEETYQQAIQAKTCLRERVCTAILILEEKYSDLEEVSRERMEDAMELLDKVDGHAILGYTMDRLDRHKQAALAGAKRLLRFEELPEQWQENKYIFSGYRFLSSNRDCFKSIFYLHNESGNIWTHLLGLFYFLIVGAYFFYGPSPYLSTPPLLSRPGIPFVAADTYDKAVFFFFFLAVYKCLLMSSLWHTFAQIAHEGTMKCMASLDYVGISTLIAASVLTLEYFGFYCDTFFRSLYVGTTLAFGVAGVIIPWLGWFDQRDTRWLRIIFFLSMAGSALVPMLHLGWRQGLGATVEWISPLVVSLGWYTLGVFLYSNHYPERIFPGRFDHFGSSHQLWHVCVLGGVYAHFMATMSFWERRYEYGCPLL